MSTNFCWELTSDGLISVLSRGSQTLSSAFKNTTETGDKGLGKGIGEQGSKEQTTNIYI